MQSVEAHLSEHQFKLDESLDHNELVAFVAIQIFKGNHVMRSYWLLSLTFFLLLLTGIALFFINANGTFTEVFIYFFYGIAITLLLIPLHELLHGLAYKSCGAHKVSYKANWKKLYFMAVADKFIAGRKQFYFIGLTPFVFISLTLIFLTIFAQPEWRIALLTALFIHATMCVGDFGLMSYFAENKNKEVITYDDVQNNISYFYSKERGNL